MVEISPVVDVSKWQVMLTREKVASEITVGYSGFEDMRVCPSIATTTGVGFHHEGEAVIRMRTRVLAYRFHFRTLS